MSIPPNVRQFLDMQNINYTVFQNDFSFEEKDQELPLNTCNVIALLLKDRLGLVKVLIPANCLLNLTNLNTLLRRELIALSKQELKNLLEKHQLDNVPALAPTIDSVTVVDRRLLKPELLLLGSGIQEYLIKISQPDFQKMLEDSPVYDLTTPVDSIGNPYDLNNEEYSDHLIHQDTDAIHKAVQSFTTIRVKQRLEQTLDLPPLPSTAQQIIQLRLNPNADVNDLAAIVETDPSLAAQVVGWAASPYYSAPGKIKSIQDAIVRVLGFDMVLNLALGLALGKTLQMPKDGPRGITPYWETAVYTAATIEGLVTCIPRKHRPEFGLAYLSGLLSNFGYLILAEVFPPHFKKICRFIEVNPHIHYSFIEQYILGVTREQLAGWLMKLWHMPPEIVTALRFQNNTDYNGSSCEYAQLTHIAQRLLRQRGIGCGPILPVPQFLYDQLHLAPSQAEETVERLMQSTEELDSIAKQLAGSGH